MIKTQLHGRRLRFVVQRTAAEVAARAVDRSGAWCVSAARVQIAVGSAPIPDIFVEVVPGADGELIFHDPPEAEVETPPQPKAKKSGVPTAA